MSWKTRKVVGTGSDLSPSRRDYETEGTENALVFTRTYVHYNVSYIFVWSLLRLPRMACSISSLNSLLTQSIMEQYTFLQNM